MNHSVSATVSRRAFLGGIGALAVTAGLGLAGCGSSSNEGSAATDASGSVKDSLSIALPAQPPTLDTIMSASSATVDVMRNVLEPLYAFDASYRPQPILAESSETSSDGLTVTFKIRSGVKFHDGSDLTADDVVASMNRWLDKNARAKQLLPGATFEKAGDLEVAAKLSAPASDLLTILAGHGQFPAIVPAKSIQAATDKGLGEFIGTGPYKLGEVKQDQYIKLERNEDYQALSGKPSGYSGKVSAPTKELQYMIVTDASTRVSGIETGEYDICDEIPTENYQDFDGNDQVKLYERNSGTLTAFFNMNKGVMANEKIRQAVLAGLDCKAAGIAAYGDEKLIKLDASMVNPDNKEWSTEAGKDKFNQADVSKAKDLLKEAGYNGETVRLLTTPDYKEMYNGSVNLQEQLGKMGIKAEVESYEFATFMDIRSSKPEEWDIFIASIGYGQLPALSLAVSTDFYGLSDQQALDLVAKTRSAATHEEAKKAWEQAQERLYDIAANIPLCHYVNISATAADVTGVEPFVGLVVWNASRPA